jgi:GT2 family glycosyltransferase
LPLVTIVTPTYNRGQFLRETIESVLSQQYPRIEYIVLDDGSTDDSQQILGTYKGRIICEAHSNQGETRTVNRGLQMARGEILSVVNSDDPLLPGAVEEAVAFLQMRPEVLVAYPDWDWIDSTSRVIRHVKSLDYDYLYMVRRHYCTVGPGAFFRRAALDLAGYRDPEFVYVADFDYWLRLGLHGPFARIPKTLATFRTHQASASSACRGAAMSAEHLRLVRKYYAMGALPLEVRRARREAFAWAHFVAGTAAGQDRRTATKHLLLAALGHPRSVLRPLVQQTSMFRQVVRRREGKGTGSGDTCT